MVSRFITTEGVFAITGGLWFLAAAIFPAIPTTMPVPAIIPGFTEITPGLLVGVALVPVIIKTVMPGRVPFVGGDGAATTKGSPDA